MMITRSSSMRSPRLQWYFLLLAALGRPFLVSNRVVVGGIKRLATEMHQSDIIGLSVTTAELLHGFSKQIHVELGGEHVGDGID